CDGIAWSLVSSPNVGSGTNFLYGGVRAVSSNDIWAVGHYISGGVSQTLTLHWNGSTWSVVSSPNVGTADNELKGLASVGTNDVWAVGVYVSGGVYKTLTMHWNGSS